MVDTTFETEYKHKFVLIEETKTEGGDDSESTHHREYESINKMKIRKCVYEVVEDILPFFKYSRSLLMNNPKYSSSYYYIIIVYFGKDGEIVEDQLLGTFNIFRRDDTFFPEKGGRYYLGYHRGIISDMYSKIRVSITDYYNISETRLENIFKHRCPFKFVKEKFYERGRYDGFNEVDALVCSKEFESINEIKSKKNGQELVDNIIPFMSYLKSLIKIENNPKYLNSEYYIYIFHIVKKGYQKNKKNILQSFIMKFTNLFLKRIRGVIFMKMIMIIFILVGLYQKNILK